MRAQGARAHGQHVCSPELGHRGGAAACGGLGTISPPLKTRVCLACDVIWESAKDQNEFILD